ncbi:MAG: hypothetical protein ACLPVY_13105 [Acidimicrobiia bacterium]
MQTLERTSELSDSESSGPGGKRRRLAVIACAVVVLVATALASYGLASARTVTKTVVTVAAPAQPAATAPIGDRGFSLLDNGHQATSSVFYQPMDAATRAELQHQLVLAREVAMRYPTVKDAEAAGWRRAGPFAPGLGAHYFHFQTIGQSLIPNGTLDDSDVLHPASLIYDGTHPNSPIAGLMYYSAYGGIPEGFAGPNDVWHFHTNVCIVYGSDGTIDTPYGADTTVTPTLCNAAHGTLMRKTQWMLHAWVVPGYDSPQGVFSHDNEAITCRDGTYNTIPLDKIGTRTSICVDGGE